MNTLPRTITAIALLAAVGCSSSEVAEQPAVEQATKVITETVSSLAMTTPDEVVEEPAEDIAPFDENIDIFSAPELDLRHVIETGDEEEEEEIDIKGEPPRLVGFVKVDAMKAMLSINKKPIVLAAGDYYKGFEVVTVEPPAVTLKHGFHQFTLNLFKQARRDDLPQTGSSPDAGPSATDEPEINTPLEMPDLPALGADTGGEAPTTLPKPELEGGDDEFSFPGFGEFDPGINDGPDAESLP